MASIEKRTNPSGATVHRIIWRYKGVKQYLTFDDEDDAKQCRALVEGHGHLIDADRAWRRFHGLPDEDEPEPPKVLTLGEWADTWFESKTGVQVDTVERYRRQWELRMRGPLAALPIGDVTPLVVRKWVAGLKPMHPATQHRYHAVLHQIMRDAAREGHITQNPCAYTKLADEDEELHEEQQVFLTHAEARLLLAAMPEGTGRDITTVLLGTGLRWGEVTALQTQDVNALAKTPAVKVQRVWKRSKTRGWYLGAPKSRRSRRSVTVSKEVLDVLVARMDLTNNDAPLFPSARGKRLDHSNFMARVWRPAVQLARGEAVEDGKPVPPPGGVKLTKSPTPHDMRHTHASWLIADRVTLVKVSRRLGHGSVAVTEQVYVHLLPDDDDELLTSMDRVLKPPRSPS